MTLYGRPRIQERAGTPSALSKQGGRPPSEPKLQLLTFNQLTFERRRARATSGQTNWPIILLVLAAVTYNGALAFLNAHGLYVTRSMVVVTEILILAAASVAILGTGARQDDGAPALFFALFLVDALAVSLFGGAAFIEMARNAAIISLFIILGSRLGPSALHKCFLLAAAAVFLVLLVEIASVEAYVSLLSPATYFAQTRGVDPAEYNDLGLFGNALGWEDRFSILKIMDHRAASIFLEQVSLGNFAVVLAIYLCCRWQHVPKFQKLALMSLIALLVITTASRAASGLVLMAPVAYWLAPKLPRFSALLVMPAIFAVALAITSTRPPTGEDNLEGRLNYTISKMGELDLPSIAGVNALNAPTFADSGYMYVIVGSSGLGLLLLALFVCFIAIGHSAELKRCSLLLSLYVFGNLMVSGTSIFSIKTAALLWLLVGFLRANDQQAEVEQQPEIRPKNAAGPPRTLLSGTLAPQVQRAPVR